MSSDAIVLTPSMKWLKNCSNVWAPGKHRQILMYMFGSFGRIEVDKPRQSEISHSFSLTSNAVVFDNGMRKTRRSLEVDNLNGLKLFTTSTMPQIKQSHACSCLARNTNKVTGHSTSFFIKFDKCSTGIWEKFEHQWETQISENTINETKNW